MVLFSNAGDWSSGMIPALGAGGREFDSRITPFYCTVFSVGGVAQMVERMLSMHEAQGSIPCSSTFFSCRENFFVQPKKNSKAGNRTRVSCVTGRNTNHYTTSEDVGHCC